MSPQISIILPTYNRASFLKKAIDSVIEQSFSDLELIIVDDASTDETGNLVNSYRDSRIRYEKMLENKGEYWATNYGFSLAKGKCTTWIHSDDIMPAKSLELRFAALMDDVSLDFVHTDINKIDINDQVISFLIASDLPKGELLREYLTPPEDRKTKYLVHHLSIMMRAGFFEKVGCFDISLAFAGDIDWLIRAIKMGNFKSIHEVLYHYRFHEGARRVQDIKNGVDKNLINRQIIEKYKNIYGLN